MDGERVFGVVEEGGLHACSSEGFGQNVTHAATRLQALHGLCTRNEVRALGDDVREVDELRGEEAVEVIARRKLVGLARKRVDVLAIEIRLGVDDKERLPQRGLLHRHHLLLSSGPRVRPVRPPPVPPSHVCSRRPAPCRVWRMRGARGGGQELCTYLSIKQCTSFVI